MRFSLCLANKMSSSEFENVLTLLFAYLKININKNGGVSYET